MAVILDAFGKSCGSERPSRYLTLWLTEREISSIYSSVVEKLEVERPERFHDCERNM